MDSGCKQILEIAVPAAEVEQETERVARSWSEKVRLPGFRPGKAPVSLVRARFAEEIREEVLQKLLPKYLQQEIENRNLNVVGRPSVFDIRMVPGEPLRFKAEVETLAEFELGEYRGLTVEYREPEVSEEEIEQRLGELREQRAEFVNLEPRPAEKGDFAVIALESVGGGEKIQRDEVVVHLGDEDTLPEFTENLLGAVPGEEREFEVHYPADYGEEKLAGRTVRFRARLKALRRKELPELNDAFAADVGDFKSLEELREAIRLGLLREKQYLAQQEAKNKLLDKLVQMHEFPVPESLVEQQIESQVASQLRAMAARGVDVRNVRLNWEKVRESQRAEAVRNVKASMIVERIADREAIEVTQEELDRELQRIARAEREPVEAVGKRLQEEGRLGRLVSRMRFEKTLNFLFEQARKVPAE